MDIKVTLTHQTVGSIVISSPDGWSKAVLGMDRHPDFHCLVESFKTPFSLYGSNGVDDGGREFFKQVATIGVDEEITVLYEASNNDEPFYTLFSGLLPLVAAIEILAFDHQVQMSIAENSLWSKFINRYETPVNILSPTDIDGNARTILTPFTIQLPTQPINKVTEYTGHSGDTTTADDCFCATTANIALAGFLIVDTVQTVDFMRVLVKNQTDQKQNGVYNVAAGAWTRCTDGNTGVEIQNMVVSVTNGAVNGGKNFRETTAVVTIGVSNIVFVETNFVDNTLMADFGYTSNTAANQLVLPGRFQQFTQDKKVEEIKDSFQYPTNFVGNDYSTPGHTVPDPEIGNVLELIDEFGNIVIDYSIDLWWSIFGSWVYVGGSFAVPSQLRIQTFITYKINDGLAIDLDFGQTDYFTGLTPGVPEGNISSGPMTYSIAGTFLLPPINRGDLVYVYLKHRLIVYHGGTLSEQFRFSNMKIRGGFVSEDIKFKFASMVPDSECSGLYAHDVLSSVLDRIIGDDSTLYSPHLGNTKTQSRVYGVAGNASMYIPLQGLQLRGWSLVDKILSLSARDCWDGLNPAFNLGLLQTVVDGEQVISVTPKAELYDASEMVILLSNVTKIKKSYDQESLVNKVVVGNEKWEAAETSGAGGIAGLDSPQTKRTLASCFRHVGKTLSLLSKWISADLTFELTRRTSVTKSANYKYDNDIFLLAVQDVGGVVSPQLDENFSSVTGLLNEPTRYNKILTPYRALLRNLNLIAGGLQDYSDKLLKFVSGEGNYAMTSTTTSSTNPEDFNGAVLTENQDIPIGSDFLHRAELYEIDHIITSAQYKTFQANRHKAIGVSLTTTDHKALLVKSTEYTKFDGTFKVVGWFKEKFDIEVIQLDNPTRIFSDEFNGSFN